MRTPKPYFKKSPCAWYATVGPNQRPVRLADEPECEKTPEDEKAA